MTENGLPPTKAGTAATRRATVAPSAKPATSTARKTRASGAATRSRRAATSAPVAAAAPEPSVSTDTRSVPAAGGARVVADRELRAAEQARLAGDARAAARPGGSVDAGRGLVGAALHLPFVHVSVALPQGARVHVGPVDAELGPRGVAVLGAAGALAAGAIEWPVAAAAVAVGVVMRRLQRRGPHR